jgi:hypothetical protein
MSSDINSSTTLAADFSSLSISTSSGIPALAALVTPTSSSTAIALTAQASHSSIGLPGTIGFSTALGLFLAAIIAVFCYYRRKRKFHKEAMLISPRLSKHANHRATEMGEDSLIMPHTRDGNLQKDSKLGALHSQSWPVVPAVSRDETNQTDTTYAPRSSSLTPSSIKLREVSSPEVTDQKPLGDNIYGIRYNTGGILTVEHDTAQEGYPENDENPPRWDEALERLNSIHADATIRRELSPAPLRIAKQTTPDFKDQIQRPRLLPHLTHSHLESISELDISENARNRDIERTRAAALAKLEGRVDRYTIESVYSRTSDGTPLYRPKAGEAGPNGEI